MRKNFNLSPVTVIILAAGKGTRLNAAARPKVMYMVKGKPMIGYLAEMLLTMKNPGQRIIVVGFKGQQVIDYIHRKISRSPKLNFVWQSRQLGTGHAIKKALIALKQNAYPIVVLNGDHPYFSRETILGLLKKYHQTAAVMVITTARVDADSSFGRIIKDKNGLVRKIVELKNCSPAQKKIKQANVGAYLFDAQWLKKNLPKIRKDQISGEYYLTDLISLAVSQGERIVTASVAHPAEAIGINTRENLAAAESVTIND